MSLYPGDPGPDAPMAERIEANEIRLAASSTPKSSFFADSLSRIGESLGVRREGGASTYAGLAVVGLVVLAVAGWFIFRRAR